MPAATGPTKARKARSSARAKDAAAVAASEGKEDEAGQVAKKPRGRPKKALAAQHESDDEVEVGDLVVADGGVVWDNTLTWSMITAVEENQAIRDSLFPGKGASKSAVNGGGKPKTDFQYKVAELIFKDHPTYGDSFSQAKTSKEKAKWTNRIKNRLKILETQNRKQNDEMGETGQGITEEDEILPGTKLTTKWDLIKRESPWFFHLRALIGERPNRNTVGVGNNQTGFDTAILLPAPASVDHEPFADDGFDGNHGRDVSEAPSAHSPARADSMSAGSDEEDETHITKDRSHKRKGSETPSLTEPPRAPTQKPLGKKPPLPGISVPASTSRPAKKSKTTAERFADTVRADEEAARQGIELKKIRVQRSRDVKLAEIRAKSGARSGKDAVKLELMKLKMEQESRLELEKLRMKQEHEYRMAELSHTHSQAAHTTPSFHHASLIAGPSSAHSDGYSAPSHSGASTPFDDWESAPIDDWNLGTPLPGPDFDFSGIDGGSSTMSG